MENRYVIYLASRPTKLPRAFYCFLCACANETLIRALCEHYWHSLCSPDEPIWMPHQRSIFYGFISGTSNLTCEAMAEPPASFAWLDKRQNPIQTGAILTETHKSTLVVSTIRLNSSWDFGKNPSFSFLFSCLWRMMMSLASTRVKLVIKWVLWVAKLNCQKEPSLAFPP